MLVGGGAGYDTQIGVHRWDVDQITVTLRAVGTTWICLAWTPLKLNR